jgi:hypothetical protein
MNLALLVGHMLLLDQKILLLPAHFWWQHPIFGNSETLGDFKNKIEGLLDTFPSDDHVFIMKNVIHQKFSDSVKCNLSPTIQTWAQH